MKTKIYIITSLIFIVLITACEKSVIPDRTKIAEGARICFINLSADGVTASITNEMNLYFGGNKVTSQQSLVTNRLRGIPFRSSYPGVVTPVPTATTAPTSYIGAEYFVTAPAVTNVVAKDTTITAPAVQTTWFDTTFTFEKDKYYSIFAMGLRAAMHPIIVEDNIIPFTTVNKTKIRVVNALYGVAGGKVDIWIVHQPATTSEAIAPYKLASGIDYKSVTAFSDTISSGVYKWTVTIAGSVPTAITPPTVPTTGKAYTLTFAAANVLIAQAAGTGVGTTFAQRTTYSLLIFGQFGKTGVVAPFGNFFRNRLL